MSKEALFMRALKVVLALSVLVVLVQFLPVYYYSFQFKDFVQFQSSRARSMDQLKTTLLSKAKEYSLPVTNRDIKITSNGAVLRVDVDYKVPVNLFVYSPELKFQALGSGLMR